MIRCLIHNIEEIDYYNHNIYLCELISEINDYEFLDKKSILNEYYFDYIFDNNNEKYMNILYNLLHYENTIYPYVIMNDKRKTVKILMFSVNNLTKEHSIVICEILITNCNYTLNQLINLDQSYSIQMYVKYSFETNTGIIDTVNYSKSFTYIKYTYSIDYILQQIYIKFIELSEVYPNIIFKLFELLIRKIKD